MTQNLKMGLKEWGMLFLLSALWGGSFFANAGIVRELPVFVTVTLRVGIAALALLLFLRLSGNRLPLQRHHICAYLGMGILNNIIPFSLIVWGQTTISASLASILNAMTPLLTVIVAHYFTADEKISISRIFGIILGIFGVIWILGKDLFQGQHSELYGQLACIVAALSYACASIFGRRFRKMEISPVQTATGQLLASTLLLLPVAMWIEKPWLLSFPSFSVISLIMFLAIGATAFAYILFFKILSRAGATNVSLVTILVPMSAMLLGYLFQGDRLSMDQFIGMFFILIGLLILDGRIIPVIFPATIRNRTIFKQESE